MSDEIKLKKGRKFLVLQEVLIFGALYIVACGIWNELTQLNAFAMTIVGAGVGYMTANAVKSIKK